MNLTIIKIGGSVITDKKSEDPKINHENLEIIASELKDFKEPYILIHGAGSYGHPLAKKTGIDKGIKGEFQLLAFAETQKLQNQLNCIVCDFLIRKDIPACPAQASSHAIMEAGRLITMNTETIAGMVKIGLIPVCYGVPAYDKLQGSSILSGDQIAPYLAKALHATRIIEACDVQGIYTGDPKNNTQAQLIKEINLNNYQQIEQYLTGSLNADVTGGMKQKYLELIAAAKEGITAQIVHYQSLRSALQDKSIGTTINLAPSNKD